MFIKAKKSLGQNFLNNINTIEKITDLDDIESKEILEIGPGTGNLTLEILKKNPKKMIVIEKDNNLANLLKEKFGEQIKIYNEDVLKIDERKISDNKLIVFGNLPYNISTKILTKWILALSDKFWFDKMFLMFQKEVADRIISKYNNSLYGRLTIIANWKLKIEKKFDIKPECFSPKPKIESTLLAFYPRENFFKLSNAKNLEKLTRIFFNERRKMLKKPYKLVFGNNINIAEDLNLDLNLRPQNLEPEIYYKLTKFYEDLRS